MPIVSKTTVRLYPPHVDIIDAWDAANPDPDIGLTPSRPTAIRRLIRSTVRHSPEPGVDTDHQPATQADLNQAVSRILERLDLTKPFG